MNKERLLLAAKILEEHADDRRGRDDKPTFYMGEYANPCGAPACVLGHVATYDPESPFELDTDSLRKIPWPRTKAGGVAIDYYDVTVCRYYDITRRQAVALFSDCGCGGAETALEAAVFIRDFVETDGTNVP